MRKKRLDVKDIEAIALIIRKQELIGSITNKENDPDGTISFAIKKSSSYIRDALLRYLEKVMDQNIIPYDSFYEFTVQGEKEFIEEHIGQKSQN